MRGYKIFDRYNRYINFPDDMCYTGNVDDENGFYYCLRPLDCLIYEDYTPQKVYAEVECDEEYITSEYRLVCKRLKFIKKLSYEEFGEMLTGNIDSPYLKCSYVNGILNGSYKKLYRDKTPSIEALYVNGKRHGDYKEWYENGQLFISTLYKDGNISGDYKQWHENGKLSIEATYKDDNISGDYKQWHENGKLNVQATYKEGEKTGSYNVWDKNGNLSIEATYDEWGRLHGIYKLWHENGELACELNYKNGKTIRPKREMKGLL